MIGATHLIPLNLKNTWSCCNLFIRLPLFPVYWQLWLNIKRINLQYTDYSSPKEYMSDWLFDVTLIVWNF